MEWSGEKRDDRDKLVHEIAFCRYAEYATVVKAAEMPLPVKVSKTETALLERLSKSHQGALTAIWSKALLFGDVAKGLKMPEKAALVKLVRRGLVKVYVVQACGQNDQGQAVGGWRHLWEVLPLSEHDNGRGLVVDALAA